MPLTQGLPVETSNRGVIGVSAFIQDQTTAPLAVPFLIERNTTTLAIAAVVGERTVTLSPGHGAVIGNILELANTDPAVFLQSEILNVVGDVITLDQPLNYAYAIATTQVVVSSKDMLVDGSVTPQVFSILPLPTQSGDMIRVVWTIKSTDSMDFTTFGGATALANGCVLRINKGDGTYRNLFNFKSNGDIINQTFDHAFLLPQGGNTTNGFTARLTWGGQSKHGVVIRLDGSAGESLELVVQDNLTTGNSVFNIWAQGHEIQA